MYVLCNTCLCVLSDPIKDQTDYEGLWVRTSIKKNDCRSCQCVPQHLYGYVLAGADAGEEFGRSKGRKVNVFGDLQWQWNRTSAVPHWKHQANRIRVLNSTGDVNVCCLFIQSLIHLGLSLGIKWRAELLHLIYGGRAANHPWQNKWAWWL